MDSFVVFGIVIFIIIVLLFHLENQRPARYPTGPFRFPFLGNIPQIYWNYIVNKKTRHEIYKDYAERYGSVFSIKFGPYNTIVLNDPKLIKEAWNNINLCGRPKLHGAAARTGGTVRGILFQDGPEWVDQRRFALRNLKDFGFGKKSMENLVLDEAMELIESLKKDVGVPISTQSRFNIAVLNSLWRIVTGGRFSQNDEKLLMIMESIQKSLHFKGIVFFFPWLKDFAPNLSGWNNYVESVTESTKFVENIVKEKLATYDPSKEPDDFSEVYIQEIRRTTDKESSFYGKRGEKTMVGTLLDLFVAGAETTSTTLTYVFLYMAMWPEKQQKVYEEIQHILGSNNPTLEDRAWMPYTDAMLQETLRYSAMVPLGIFHKALANTRLGPYTIPKDTFITPNLYWVHHSKDIWKDPENFRPERFLTTTKSVDGDRLTVIKHEALIPFSYGKRICLGEALAKDELFLMTVSLLQNFQVGPSNEPNAPKLTTKQLSTTIISPPAPHKLVFSLREHS